MSQASDIVLNGDPYMLVAASGREGYRRSQDGIDEGRTGRITQTDFFGGTGRALQLERDRGFASLEVGPALGGQGVAPWPFIDTLTLPSGVPLGDRVHEYPHAIIRDHLYLGIGQYLYRAASLAGGSWAPPVQVYDAGAGNTIWSIVAYGWNILLSFGLTKEITHGLYPDFSSPTVLFTGAHGYHMVAYQGFAIWADARGPGVGYQNMLQMVTGTGIQSRRTAAPIRRLTTAQAEVVIATHDAVYTYAGRVAETTVPNASPPPDDVEVERWTGDVTPFFQHGLATFPDDFRFLVGFGGRTYAWLAGMVLEHDPNGERAGWRETGLGGARCFGACVAAGYLIVSLLTHDQRSQVWAWDGAGWWCLVDHAASVATWLTPVPLGGLDGFDVGVFREGSRDLKVLRLLPRSPGQPAIPAIAANPAYITSMIDAGERDKSRAWRRIGATFATPQLLGNAASTDPVTVHLDWSTNAGETWHTATSYTASANTLPDNLFEITHPLAGAVDPWLMLRVRWSGTFDWAPVLTGLWAEYEVMESPARRRRWQLTVQAEDQVVDREGGTLTRTGRQQIAELWNHWQQATPLPFRDLDYDDDPVERQVRIVGISEAVPAPHQAGLWGQSSITLTLVEV